jgi:hypothetical protein
MTTRAKTGWWHAGAAVAAVLAAGCQSTVGAGPAVKSSAERSFVNCPLQQPGRERTLLTLNSAADWSSQLARTEADVLGAPVPWASARVLIVSLGTMPTGGHSVRHFPPPPDAMVPQALTSPCVLAVVPRAGWQQAKLAWPP